MPTWIDATRSSSLLSCCILTESCSDSARTSSPARCTKSGSSWVKSNPSKPSSSSATDELFAMEWFLAWTNGAGKVLWDMSSAETEAYTQFIIKLPISPNGKQKRAIVFIFFTWPTAYLQYHTLTDNIKQFMYQQQGTTRQRDMPPTDRIWTRI